MIDILLSTFNGGKYLAELLESLKAQSSGNFRLLIRDDGSSDNTLDIIKAFEKEQALNLKLIAAGRNIGASASFGLLLKESTADYVMFCDQDDVWLPQKIERTLAAMREAETANSADMPLLVFSDLKVVDIKLNLLNGSFFKYQGLDPARLALPQLLVQNVPSACTILVNRALVKLIGEIPGDAVMHDHWLSLVTAAFGKFVFLNEATILYRQHKNNTFGAEAYGWSYFYRKCDIYKLRKRFYLNVVQAEAFRRQYGEMLTAENLKMLDEFAGIGERNWFARRKILCKYKIYKSSLLRNLGAMLII